MNIDTADFPFVASLPKAERKIVRSLYEQLQDFLNFVSREEPLVPVAALPGLCGVSRQRAYQLIEAGRFDVKEFMDHRFVTSSSLLKFVMAEKSKGGRGVKVHVEYQNSST
jgi:hypothetical protein